MLISIITAAVAESLIGESVEKIWRILLKIALLPVVAGLSYELLKGLAKTDCVVFLPLKVPGMLLQRITTREPDDKMLEVAITAFTKVIKMEEDKTIPEEEFVVSLKREQVIKQVKEKLAENGILESAEGEWIVSIILGVKRNELYTENLVSPLMIEKINKVVDERITGRPLWYCIGDTDFYGYKIKVDERVLIPRPETELLVENAIKHVNDSSKVLDLCTGSGAIAIAIKKQTNAKVTAIDISVDALDLAKENAKLNDADIEFIESDLFEKISDGNDRKFDLIVSNPPYIKSQEISELQKEVKDFEPILALDGGEDGFEFYKIIASASKNYLEQSGVLLLECGIGQAQEIASMLTDFSSVEIIKDYENIDRIVKAVL
jgi:release factor glutamine methyltransferase